MLCLLPWGGEKGPDIFVGEAMAGFAIMLLR